MTNSGWKLKRVTSPAIEPVTVAEARKQCNIDIQEDDVLVARLIKTAREHAEQYTRRAFVSQVWEAGYPCFPSFGFQIAKPPLIEVLSIVYDDDDGVEQTLAGTQWRLDTFSEPGMVLRPNSVTWPVVSPDSGMNVRIQFRAGYAGEGSPADGAENVPAPIQHAILMCVAHWYENREAVHIGAAATQMPIGAMDLLESYRVYGWGDA